MAVFLPTDPEYTWMIAKMHHNMADASVHQSCTHLGFTHLVIESIAVCANRNLSPSHPIHRLLAPHHLYVIAINSRALAKLVAPGGWVDKCMHIGHVGMYDAEEKLKNDYELQAWVQEMTAPPPEGFGIKGVPGGGLFSSTGEIVEAVTSMIFISSVGHAASNFPQYDEYAFPTNYPAMLQGEIPRSKVPINQSQPQGEELSEKSVLDQLPDKQTTLDIMVVTKLLSERGTNTLTEFEIKYQYDSTGETAVNEFRKELIKIAGIITEGNKTRDSPYPYLDPREVSNAISI
uniref:Arachidonate 12-lipoxygenase, 12R-type-like n=1 Tax=Saccoglossus kowalevskii TaxID=10224 RepID=A0ABM0M977_SACKO|nr:PREDICTED: arachidonate 12-lipoxygenase, 12R-type-like [Saccoglossus kowalevskii]